MKKLTKKIVFNKSIARLLIRPILSFHSTCYNLAGRYATLLNDGIHPKHRILRYKEWFLKNIQPGWTVVDIGSNTGMLSFMLAEKAKFVYGIEKDNDYVAIAKTKFVRDNIEYICADATTYDYNSCQPVNCVAMSNVLEHIESRVEFLKRIIRQINWEDNDHKHFLFRVPMFDREWVVPYKKSMHIEYRLDLTHCIEYTLESFTDEIGKAGINMVSYNIRFGELYAVCEVVCS